MSMMIQRRPMRCCANLGGFGGTLAAIQTWISRERSRILGGCVALQNVQFVVGAARGVDDFYGELELHGNAIFIF